MTESVKPGTTCPACGAAAGGSFCAQCGASLAVRACARCTAPLRAGARFCHRCGHATAAAPAVASPSVGGQRLPWLVAGLCAIGAIALVALRGVNTQNGPKAPPPLPDQVPAPAAAGGGAAATTDIASMSPAERFNRLFNRVMRAAGSGDSAQAMQFAPMAISAYGMLDQAPSADERLHAGLVYLVQGDARAVTALADTLLRQHPDHLFGYVLRGEAAKLSGDQPALQRARADFASRLAKETARTDRPEYQEHQPLLDEFRQP
ncbi:MAG: zinc ribbon domain-containing protein [Gemmatimonadales bacterium]|jgi:hypothetical protein|nr:zinc ribbon domain-containing protein [Gemmatimonadales bacterium]